MIALILSVILSNSAYAQSKTKTIPFVYETTSIADVSKVRAMADLPGEVILMGQPDGKTKAVKRSTKHSDVEASKVADLVRDVKESVCEAIKKGSFKVWLKFDTDAKILGIGASSEGGVEVTVNCG